MEMIKISKHKYLVMILIENHTNSCLLVRVLAVISQPSTRYEFYECDA